MDEKKSEQMIYRYMKQGEQTNGETETRNILKISSSSSIYLKERFSKWFISQKKKKKGYEVHDRINKKKINYNIFFIIMEDKNK